MDTEASFVQSRIARESLEILGTVSASPAGEEYLERDVAAKIVDATLAAVQHDSVEHRYLVGHRKRLIETLSIIPKAASEDAAFLDIGCYGYFGFWAALYLGYSRVVGTEMPLQSGEASTTRKLSLNGKSVELEVHHFDLTETEWPLKDRFDTVICLEVLEHVNHDPSGVLLRLRNLMKQDATLVFSVPNAVSYKTLGEFMSGMPPWTYWFYRPDLDHEPRHSLEYTPFLASLALRAAGFELQSFKTIIAYTDSEAVADLYKLGEVLGVEPSRFGETIIATARKSEEDPPLRFPDAIYNGDGYYASTWPMIDEIKRAAVDKAYRYLRPDEDPDLLSCLKREKEALQAELRQKTVEIAEMAFLLDTYDRLQRYRHLSLSHIRRTAEQGELPAQKDWKVQLLFYSFRAADWLGLRRLLRRFKSNEYINRD